MMENSKKAKGYWIARVDMKEGGEKRYKDYIATAFPAFKEYGAKFLVRGGQITPAEGQCRQRNVIIEFESLEIARACYNSAQYQKAAAIRCEVSEGEIVLVEGIA